MPIQEQCRIIEQKKVGPRHFKLTLLSPNITSQAKPGQFVEVKCSDNYEPLLRRPISLHKVNLIDGTFELLYEVVGIGTELLSKYKADQELDILGPLGTGFKIDPAKKVHVLIGGGMGVAPLLALATQITNNKLQITNATYILLGARSKDFVIEEKTFRSMTDQILVSTDDGTYGKKGFISDILLDLLNNTLTPTTYNLTTLYACGPKPMLRAVAEIAYQKKIDCQLSMEERMACGIGACKGCAVKTTNGYKMACKDGPVFDSKEIIW
ncbi:MAG: dihydroorotate dehydrogenase electron transfer subunit [bacterium]